jgi:hypothetical protein
MEARIKLGQKNSFAISLYFGAFRFAGSEQSPG